MQNCVAVCCLIAKWCTNGLGSLGSAAVGSNSKQDPYLFFFCLSTCAPDGHLLRETIPDFVHCFKNPTHALCFKMHTKTRSLVKTLECLRLLCHPTCFGHTLDHLQGMFLVQCCFPPCCFVTILLGYVAV